MEVIGSNAVYVIDGRSVSYTNVSEATTRETMSMHDVRLHILADGKMFDLQRRSPQGPKELENLEERKAARKSR
jgi:cyanophycinase